MTSYIFRNFKTDSFLIMISRLIKFFYIRKNVLNIPVIHGNKFDLFHKSCDSNVRRLPDV